jgi:DNA-binding HxlR family transcriptional regulator
MLPGITQAMLTGQLRELEGNHMIHRKVFAEVPPHVEYSLTPLGTAFKPVLESILQWGQEYIAAVAEN